MPTLQLQNANVDDKFYTLNTQKYMIKLEYFMLSTSVYVKKIALYIDWIRQLCTYFHRLRGIRQRLFCR